MWYARPMELMGYLGQQLYLVLTPEIVTGVLIGLGVIGGGALLMTIRRR